MIKLFRNAKPKSKFADDFFKHNNFYKANDIAVIGMACRFPGAKNYKQFWQNLADGRNHIQEITQDRWDIKQFYSTDINAPNKSISKWAGLLDDIWSFDNSFFNISPREAQAMDPQQRLLLEETWHCLEDAGMLLADLQQNKTSVYVGVMASDYQYNLVNNEIDSYACLGNYECILANRLSYCLNLTGESKAIDTACSSSLVALHNASINLKQGESVYALAAGVNIICHPLKYIAFSKSHMLSPDGQCKTFDQTANGYVPGEGIGVLLLTTLERALMQGHRIHGVIKGSAVNHSGKTISITAPKVEAQRDVIIAAQRAAGVSASHISYIEAHGTGTSLGDPIEVAGLNQAFAKNGGTTEQHCYIGSVKTNIGHLEATAGIAGIIKVMLMMQYGKLVPTLNIKTVNPIINFAQSPFKLSLAAENWEKKNSRPYYAGVSSFGFGGVNSHVVLMQVPAQEKIIKNNAVKDYPFILSAKTEQNLQMLIKAWQHYCQSSDFSETALADISYNLLFKREMFPIRYATLISDKSTLTELLNQFSNNSFTGFHAATYILGISDELIIEPMLFAKLCCEYKELAESFIKCCKQGGIGYSKNWLRGCSPRAKQLQLYRFAVQYALTEYLLNLEIKPKWLWGKGLGRIVAAAVCRLLSIKDAVALIKCRQKETKLADLQINLLPPQRAIYDGYYDNVVYPNKLTLDDWRAWREQLSYDDKLLADLANQARQMISNQFTFKKYIQYWDQALTIWNFNIESLLCHLESNTLDEEKKLLLFTILLTGIRQLQDKWHLANNINREETKLDQFINFILETELAPEFIIKFLLQANDVIYAQLANIPCKLTHLISNNSHTISHSVSAKTWLTASATNYQPEETQKVNNILIGVNEQEALQTSSFSLTNLHQWRHFILKLWQMNLFDTRLRSVFSEVSAKIIDLPHYEFSKNSYQLTKLDSHSTTLNIQPSRVDSQFQPVELKRIDMELIQMNESLEQIRNKLQELIQKTLYMHEQILQIDKPFAEYGMDSITAVELMKNIKLAYGLELSAAKIYAYPTLRTLSEYLVFLLNEGSNKFNQQNETAQIIQQSEAKLSKRKIKLSDTDVNSVKTSQVKQPDNDEIAIIGMSAYVAGARTKEMFWSNLAQGKDCITEIPLERWKIATFYDPNLQAVDKTYCKWGGFIEDVDKFDPLFFNISPHEAEWMDPQQRLFMQASWEALEDAGHAPEKLNKSRCGIYAGVMNNDYHELIIRHRYERNAQQLVGNSNSILAARIAYALNLKGPVMTIDTACSSSLVAIHKACQSLQQNEADLMLAGGVTLYLTETPYILMSKAGMLSPYGHCKTFDASADGFVPGEGCGVIVLKRLADAIRDRDRIYGIVKGSGINQDGKTNGITAPNGESQKVLVSSIYRQFNINPADISYIEAHGTGTKLGDPIEVEALTEAFREYTQEKNYCAIGAVKSNIGHTSAAAGVISVIKVLLMLKHKQLVPTLNYKISNEHINFEQSPFYVNTQFTDWSMRDNRPRLAAVSSFGFSGTNAHIILEEVNLEQTVQVLNKPYYMVMLSARQENTLKKRISDLISWLEDYEQDHSIRLEDISYTLNACRKHFTWRCALVVASKSELKTKLLQLTYRQPVSGCFYYQPSPISDTKTIYDEAFASLQEKLKQVDYTDAENYQQLLNSIANLYVQGYNFNWELLHQGENLQKISLPTYPFLKERFWINSFTANTQESILHPLISKNTSTFLSKSYLSELNAHAFYLRDHIINEQKLLPGVCYIEIACAAGELAYSNKRVTGIKKLVWPQPVLVAHEPVELKISLIPKEENVFYEITDITAAQLYSQGELVFDQILLNSQFDVEAIIVDFNQHYSREKLYQAFNSHGFIYGISFQTLEWLKSDGKQVLAFLSLPHDVKVERDRRQYILHPSLLDGALQTALGWQLALQRSHDTFLPFALDEIKIYCALPDEIYVLAEQLSSSGPEIQRYHMRILNKEGDLLVELVGFTMRQLPKQINKPIPVKLYTNYWQSTGNDYDTSASKPTGIIAIGGANELIDKLINHLNVEITHYNYPIANNYELLIPQWPENISHILYLPLENSDAIIDLFNLTKALFKIQRYQQIQLLCINQHSNDLPWGELICGFAKTVALENPRYQYRVVFLPNAIAGIDWRTIINELNRNGTAGEIICYKNAERYTRTIEAIPLSTSIAQSIFKVRGVYLITGGLGGLGLIFADYLIKNYQANVIVLGRSELTEERTAALAKLKSSGSEVLYYQCDINDLAAVIKLIQVIKTKFDKLNGVIHAAGIVRDSLILNKTTEDFTQVLAPKMQGAINLDEATKQIALDFMILFSSIASVLGNIGQADYASANAFMDGFAYWRNTQVEQGKRYGHTLAINWPFWQEGGMQLDTINQELFTRRYGFLPLPTDEGITAFEQLLNGKYTQGIVIAGESIKFEKAVGINQLEKEQVNSRANIKLSNDSESVRQELLRLCSQVLRVRPADLDVETNLADYGLDSILMTKLLNEIEKYYDQTISPDALINYPTVASFSKYLISEKIASPLSITSEAIHEQSVVKKAPINQIAVIGMAGRFPYSASLEIFWQHLLQGTDLIQEVPASRWLLNDYYNPDQAAPHKSYSKWAGFIDEIEYFAADYFGVSADDAIMLDPPQRLLLEITQELIDRAGYKKEELAGSKTGVFIGGGESQYQTFYADQISNNWRKHSLVNHIQNMQAARIADFYNFTGPAFTIDTACSSSLVAVHQACQSLLSGESEFAIAGGVEVLIGPKMHIGFSKAQVLSDDNKSYVFDERAKGFVLGEGVGLVLLKPYQKALEDGDQILGIILGSAVNNDGRTIGLTVPSLQGQKEVIKTAINKSGIAPDTISYYEAHGTGTLLGDPIEIKAMTEVYKEYTQATGYCAVGSVKSNIGHSLRAAGIASLIKVLLCLQHKQLVSTLHCAKPHPRFNFANSPFYPITANQAWFVANGSRRAAISSFGFGGTNCHLILEEAPENYQAKRQALLCTPLNKQRYWLDQHKNTDLNSMASWVNNLKISDFKQIIKGENLLLSEHRLFNRPILMGVAYASLVLQGVRQQMLAGQYLKLEKLLFNQLLVLENYEQAEIEINYQPVGQYYDFSCNYIKRGLNTSLQAATGKLSLQKYSNEAWNQPIKIVDIKKSANKIIAGELFYKASSQAIYGSSLFSVKQVYYLENEVWAEIALTNLLLQSTDQYILHPALLDAMHVAIAFALAPEQPAKFHWPPLLIKDMQVNPLLLQSSLSNGYAQIKIIQHTTELIEANTNLYTTEGELMVKIIGFCTKRISQAEALRDNLTRQSQAGLTTIKTAIGHYIEHKFMQIIGRKPDRQTNFMMLGLDSNSMIRLVKELEQEVGIELYPTLFFEKENITKLIDYLAEEHADALQSFLANTDLTHTPINLQNSHLDTENSQITNATVSTTYTEINEQHSLSVATTVNQQDIAVIGMAGRFAKSKNLTEFWQNLIASRDLITEVPNDHWDYHPWFSQEQEASNKTYSKWGSFLADIDKFDPQFFDISGREAVWTDPQLRLLLEIFQETIDDAALGSQIMGSNTGVYVGSCFHEYWDEIVRAHIPLEDYQHHSSVMSSLSARVSYTYDLRGSSVPLDNACASSLTALHLACQALRLGEQDLAFVAGVNLLLSPLHYVYFSRIKALSPSGHCYSFDERGNGYVPGEGVVAVLLKPLAKALADGDRIHAIIKGSALNHVGRAANPLSPRPEQQIALLTQAWNKAGIDPASLTYIEAHGTGTKLGDPIEVNALKQAFKPYVQQEGCCAIGSAKSHLGHLEAAAGLTGVVKVILSMQHKQIPKMPMFEKLNSYIKLDGSPLYINTEVQDWKVKSGLPRRAGVSAFGMTGNNAHVVLEEAPVSLEPRYANKLYYLITLSAKQEAALTQQLINLIVWLNEDKNSHLEDIAYTLNAGRLHYQWRCAIVTSSREDLTNKLIQLTSQQQVADSFWGYKKDEAIDESLVNDCLARFNTADAQPAAYKMLLTDIGKFYVQGYEPDWNILHQGENRQKISLPAYAFVRESYWFASPAIISQQYASNIRHYLLPEPELTVNGWIFKFALTTHGNILLEQHTVFGMSVLPVDALIELVYASAKICCGIEATHIKDFVIYTPLLVGKQESIQLELIFALTGSGGYQVNLNSTQTNMLKQQHMSCLVEPLQQTKPDISKLKFSNISHEYNQISELLENDYPIQLGEFFQAIEKFSIEDKYLIAQLKLPQHAKALREQFYLQPSIVDSALSMVVVLAHQQRAGLFSQAYIPIYIEEVQVFSSLLDNQYTAIIESTLISEALQRFNLYLLNDNKEVVIFIKGLEEKLIEKHDLRVISTDKTTACVLTSAEVINTQQNPTDKIMLISLLKEKLSGILSQILMVSLDSVMVDKGFNDLGMDSILSIEFIKKINHDLDVNLKVTVLYEHSTLTKLIEYLVNQYEEKWRPLVDTQLSVKTPSMQVQPAAKLSLKILDREQLADNGEANTIIDMPHIEPLVDLSTKTAISYNDIAIVGVALKFPHANNLKELWQHLEQGQYLLEEIPADHWDYKPFYQPDSTQFNKIYARCGGFIQDVDKFDPAFFNISPKDAELMDPQLRLLLQASYGAIEDAGYAQQIAGSKTGIYIGNCFNDYLDILKNTSELDYSRIGIGNHNTMLANRIGYFLDTKGPNLTLDTACSSSLVALHLACQGINNNECDAALVGGVNLNLTPYKYLSFCAMQAFSKKDEITPFDEAADGYLPGEGVAVLLIKPLSKAIADHDHVYAVIKATAVNFSGRGSGPTVPNPEQEKEVMLTAWEKAGISPDAIDYFEAHGTGTKLGDPLEINAIIQAFAKYQLTKKEFCALGTIKANIGHTEAVAGLAGIMKILLQFKYNKLPTFPKLTQLNAMITLENSPLYINNKCVDWPKPADRLRTSVISSFGIGGTYAHAVLSDPPEHIKIQASDTKPYYLITLSAKQKEALDERISDLLDWLLNQPDKENISLEMLSYTLNNGREHFIWRCALVVSSIEELQDKLKNLNQQHKAANCHYGNIKNRETHLDKVIYDEVFSSAINQLQSIDFYENIDRYHKLLNIFANLYINGYNLNWPLLHRNENHQKISLPTYPFLRQRYWIPTNSANKKQENLHGQLFAKQWQPTTMLPKIAESTVNKIIILFNKRTLNFAKELAEKFKENLLVNIDQLTEHELYEPILNFTCGKNAVLCDLSDINLSEQEELYFKVQINLLQQLITHFDSLYLVHVTQRLPHMLVEGNYSLSGALSAGLYKMLAAEYAKVKSKTVDMELLDGDAVIKEINELQKNNYASEVCYRNNKRYIPSIQPITESFDFADLESKIAIPIDVDKVYVITGGIRGIGAAIAEYLVAQGAKKLVLMGRQKLPKDSDWHEMIQAKTINVELLKKLVWLQSLKDRGIQVEIYTDKLEQTGLSHFMAKIRHQLGIIGGVIHCAGVIKSKTPAFTQKSWHEIATVLEPKVAGLQVLHEIFKQDNLNFFILFSSISSQLPSLAAGFSDYAMANYYMDLFALYQRAQGYLYYQSLNWPSWADVGIGKVKTQRYIQLGLMSHQQEEGFALLSQSLKYLSQYGQLIPAIKPAISRFEYWLLPRPVLVDIVENNSQTQLAQNDVQGFTVTEDLHKKIIEWLKVELAQLLKSDIALLDAEIPFGEYGVDSILIASLIRKLEEYLGVNIEPNAIIEYPTLYLLAQYLIQQYGAKLNTLTLFSNVNHYSQSRSVNYQPIAVIGLACHFPGADNKESFWENLSQGKSSIIEVPETRWNTAKFYSSTSKPGKSISKWGGFINDIDYFDPDFFDIPAEEAVYFDPLVRQCLETGIEALNDAGYQKNDVANRKIGVFIGSRVSNYSNLFNGYSKNSLIGLGQNFIAAMLSHVLNLNGPNLVVDTACSSSLVSIHLACQSLQQGECEMAFAGGVDILLDEQIYIALSQAKALSPDGKCHTFDEQANGFVPGEGCGIVLLKPLDKALSDGDHIYGIIASSAVNNDGKTMGVTTPNPAAQQAVIADALKKASINPNTITYIETHGTGTFIGDPIELKALTQVFRSYMQEQQTCAVGSVKSNIGHLLSAAGVASFIKVMLAMQHKRLPPTLNCDKPNPRFNFSVSPFYPNTILKAWEPRENKWIAGISAFGFGGTNAHLIVQSFEEKNYFEYQKNRTPLSPIKFNKKRYWPEKEIKKILLEKEAMDNYFNMMTEYEDNL